MTVLSREQHRFLKSLFLRPLLSEDDLSEDEKHILLYLQQLDYVTIKNKIILDGSVSYSEVEYLGVSEKGTAYLYEYRRTMLCFMLPTAISLASLFISLFSLLFK